MSKTTTNYGLIKPELTDAADITAMNKNWDTIDTKIAELSGIELRVSDLEWITLGSVSYSNSVETADTKVNVSKSLTIPCDTDILNEMTDFRYVLKKGAYFYVYSYCNTSNKSTNASVNVSNIISIGVSDAGYSGTGATENSVTTDRDIVLRKGKSTTDSLTVSTEGTIVCTTTDSPIDLATISCTLNVNNEYMSSGPFGNGKAACSFTIELQGKR